MSRRLLAFYLTVAALPLAAQRPPLPVPLRLPPGRVQILPIDKAGSFMGDAIRVVDCPEDDDNPFGTCGNVLFGGVGLYNSHLTGSIVIRFSEPVGNITRFEISHPGNLTGDDVLMRMPQLYSFLVNDGAIIDAFDRYSEGDLNLLTGEITNLRYTVNFFNLFYYALGLVNPRLKPPPFTFPGTYGSAEAKFEQRSDGLLDFTFYGSTFLPLGNNIEGTPVRLPLPFCGPVMQCGSIQVPGMSLHPHLRITTKRTPEAPACGSKCPDITPNTVVELTLNSRFSSIGDNFTLNVPLLQGPATGRSQMQGRIQVQFGERNGDYIPVALSAMPPSALMVPPPEFPIAGLSLGFLGHDEKLVFPGASYDVTGVAITDDPFDIPVGELNAKTGQFVGDVLWRTFWNTSLILTIVEQNTPRLLPQSFLLRGPASFEKGPNSSLVFRYRGDEYRPFDGFTWPSPDLVAARGIIAGPGSLLDPFFFMQAVSTRDNPTATMSGSESNVLSSYGERFSYNFSVPCDAAGKAATFEYDNQASGSTGGRFVMDNLASVTCFNSMASTNPEGNYDSIAFTGFGSWSKDADDGLHLATVTISQAPNARYVSILIDGGTESNVNTKPPATPEP
jgi:hypothetical protein